MTVLAFNGSPRRNGTTAKLLEKALEGAASKGAETEFVQLNKLTMRGCQGCFSCKKRGGESYGRCILDDDMTPYYKKIESADGIFMGSPIYFGSITSELKMLIDRMFTYLNFGNFTSNMPRKVPVGVIYTQGVAQAETYDAHIKTNQGMLAMLFGSAETLVSTCTFHVPDYSEIVADALEPMIPEKRQYQEEEFPKDCDKAFDMGARFAEQKTA